MLAWWEIVLRMLLASLLGGLIGWERETRGKPAGLRTLIIVSLSASVYVIVAQQAALANGEPVDSVRAMSGVAQGVGFLGAGIILQSRGEVRWLTTAAALWASAALGLASGLGMYFVAILAALMIFATLRWALFIEEQWARRRPERTKSPKSERDEHDSPVTKR